MTDRIDLTKADYPTLQEIAGGIGINKGQSKDKLIEEITAAWKSADEGAGGGGDTGEGSPVDVAALQEQLAAAEIRAEVAEAAAGDNTPESLRSQLAASEARAKAAEGRVLELKAGGAVVKDPKSPVDVERKIRMYQKKDGGFRKGLSEAGKTDCRKMLKKANAMLEKGAKPRTIDDGWNLAIMVPGFEQSLLNSPADKQAEAGRKIREAAALLP